MSNISRLINYPIHRSHQKKKFGPKLRQGEFSSLSHILFCNPQNTSRGCIIFFQDLLEVTPAGHADRVSLQLSLTHLECMAELINSRRKESEMKSYLKYLDTQISQLSKVSCVTHIHNLFSEKRKKKYSLL